MFLNNMEESCNTSAKRVRKKSAKLKEMEESEALERKVVKSFPKGGAATSTVKVTSPPVRKKLKKSVSQTDAQNKLVPETKPEYVPSEQAPLKLCLPSSTVKSPTPVAPFILKDPLPVKKDDKELKRKPKSKKIKLEKDSKLLPELAPISSTDASTDTYPTVTVKQQPDSGLKLKLCLNNLKEETSDLKSDDEQPAIWPVKELVNSQENQILRIVKLKKKKKSKKLKEAINGDGLKNFKPEVPPSPEKDMDLPNEEGKLIIDTEVVIRKKKEKGSKKKKKVIKSDTKQQDPDHKISSSKTQDIESDNGEAKEEKPKAGVRPVNLYSNTEAMALKLKTSSEKKVTGASKEKDKLKKKKFRRSGPTAYTMFCNNYRPKVISENPRSDFAQTSKRLGEIWQCLPAKEKMFWKRKARQRLNRMKKLADNKNTGGAKASVISKDAFHSSKPTHTPSANNKLVFNKRSGKFGPRTKLTAAEAAEVASSSVLGQLLTSHLSETEEAAPATDTLRSDKDTPCDPIDVAAHLKLLGDSLHTIGSRLQEHKGPIAVQGSLSVLLDTSICAMGALMCLTNQVPELKKIPNSLHSENLDNIAYIMPGIG